MAKHTNRMATRKKQTSWKRPLAALFIVAILTVLALFLLETLKKRAPEKLAEQPVPAERHKMPARTGETTVIQHPYTTAIPPRPPHPPRVARPWPSGAGNVAIIVDDMGSSVREAEELMAIKLPLTFSIIPSLAKVKGVAEAAHGAGYQVMIHIPMEPQRYPQQRMERDGLLVSLSDGEIEKRLENYLHEVPYAVGANNHMGSRFTEERDKMEPVLAFLKDKGLFFIDSKTTPHSVGSALAREMGLRTASRSVFIDNIQDVAAIRKQLEELTDIARQRGAAIGICHPHKTTIAALTTLLPEMHKAGINFVYAADLVR